MRAISPRWAALAFLSAALCACAEPRPPAGRWEGVYADGGLLVVARLEIAPDGAVRVSAPNAITEGAALPDADRARMLDELKTRLAQSWPAVEPLPLEFDGRAFRKRGGVAPQLEWDAERKRMTMIYYSGNRPSVRVALAPVREFGQPNS
jgi:hypothetical protein